MIRAILVLLAFFSLTLVLAPFQLIGLAFGRRLQRTMPLLYHRILCRLFGVRISQIGRRSTVTPALILSNHVSWLDICVISALAPVVFVAKSEVAGWPVFGRLAKLQRTVFVNRRARHRTSAATREIAGRLLGGDAVVLFAEGTSSDGVRVLPFRSSLVGAVHQALGESTEHTHITVQPMSLAYVGFGGVPMGRGLRERVAWYGDADLMPHLLRVLASGAIDVTVSWGEAVAYDMTKRGTAAPQDTRFAKAPALRDRYVTPRNEDIVEKLQAFAEARGHTMLELAFSWLASRPQVASVIAGATRVEQVEQNVKAIGWQLSAEELAEIDKITKG